MPDLGTGQFSVLIENNRARSRGFERVTRESPPSPGDTRGALTASRHHGRQGKPLFAIIRCTWTTSKQVKLLLARSSNSRSNLLNLKTSNHIACIMYLHITNMRFLMVSLECIADMDSISQPQRPTRTLRAIYGDENVIPMAGTQKSLHQRNKSSPALSTMHQAGGLKLAAKRTAFGDVSNVSSNTTNLSRPSKDDSAIGAKGEYNILEKMIPTQQDKKASSFLRPAQRPLSVSGLKGLLNNVANSTSLPSVKQPLIDIQQPLQQGPQAANTRKLVTKKSTAVFKDAVAAQPQHSAPEVQKPLPTTAPTAPVHRELQTRQQLKESDESREQRPKPQPTQGKQGGQVVAQEPAAAPSTTSATQASSEEPAVLRSDGIYINEHGQVQFYGLEESLEHVDSLQPSDKGVLLAVEVPNQNGKVGPGQVLDAYLATTHPELHRRPTLPPVSEPEEYWDDEGEENYDEEGYVTARSFKSRGENTTGGATTVLFPKVNQKTRKEIAAAKELIEGSKTAEELEDEAWDTTMVAEYGEEIFQYMKDLEVRDTFKNTCALLTTYDRSKCCQTRTTWITRQKYSGPCVPY